MKIKDGVKKKIKKRNDVNEIPDNIIYVDFKVRKKEYSDLMFKMRVFERMRISA